MKDDQIRVTGGCLCGDVRFEITSPIRDIVNCHCSKCRKFHGNYGSYTMTALEGLVFVKGSGLKWYRSTTDETEDVYRGFCSTCGSSLFWHPKGEENISVAAGALDMPTGLATIGHIWVEQKGDYYEIGDDLPQYGRRGER